MRRTEEVISWTQQPYEVEMREASTSDNRILLIISSVAGLAVINTCSVSAWLLSQAR